MKKIAVAIAAAFVAATSTMATAQPRFDHGGPDRRPSHAQPRPPHAQPHRPDFRPPHAQPHRPDFRPPHAQPHRPDFRPHQPGPFRWQRGQRWDGRYHAAPVHNWRTYRLRAPARGQYWVRSGDQFLLITAAGLIAAIAAAR